VSGNQKDIAHLAGKPIHRDVRRQSVNVSSCALALSEFLCGFWGFEYVGKIFGVLKM
jgi:hypothetical protein